MCVDICRSLCIVEEEFSAGGTPLLGTCLSADTVSKVAHYDDIFHGVVAE